MREITKDIEKINNLKVGDIILVKWHYNAMKHITNGKEFISYDIENIKPNGEIICRIEGNHYFQPSRIGKGSDALRIWLIKKVKI